MRRAGLLACLAVWCSLACVRPAPPPTPVPTATTAPQPTVDAQAGDIQDAFISNVNDLTSEVSDLAITPCDQLMALVAANPNEVTQIHGFAATLKRVGGQQAALNTDDVRAALAALDMAISQFDATLGACGIRP